MTTTFEQCKAKAEEVGKEYGVNAAGWYFNGDIKLEQYKAVLKGIEEGDPQTLDTFPSSPLSGEFADGLAEADVLNEIGYDPPEDDLDRYRDESEVLINLFLDAYHTAAQDEIEAQCRAALGRRPYDEGGN